MADDGGEGITRREVSILAGGATLGTLLGVGTQPASAQSFPDDFHGVSVLVGEEIDKPEQGGSFFDNKTRYNYLYVSTDSDSVFHIDETADAWTKLGEWGTQGFSPSVSDDGTEVETSPDDINFSGDVGVSSDGDGTATVSLSGVLKTPGSLTQPNLTTDTWRTPNQNRPTFITASVTLNPGATTAAEMTLDVDEDGGTSPDYSHPNRVPAALSAEQIRPVSSVVVPAGGAYRFRVISSGDETSINTLVEHTL